MMIRSAQVQWMPSIGTRTYWRAENSVHLRFRGQACTRRCPWTSLERLNSIPCGIVDWSENCLFVHRHRLPRPSWDGWLTLTKKNSCTLFYIPLSSSSFSLFSSCLGRDSKQPFSKHRQTVWNTCVWYLQIKKTKKKKTWKHLPNSVETTQKKRKRIQKENRILPLLEIKYASIQIGFALGIRVIDNQKTFRIPASIFL
jgi:hypothetical protein